MDKLKTAGFKRLIIWTLVLNLLIIIAAGHGGAFLGLLEIFWLPNFYGIGTEDFSFSLTSSYEKTLRFVALLSLVGQIFLIASLIFKEQAKTGWALLFGLLFLWTGFFYLIHDMFFDPTALFGFVTGLPFLIISLILAYKIIKHKNSNS
jgi:hypothetical protein